MDVMWCFWYAQADATEQKTTNMEHNTQYRVKRKNRQCGFGSRLQNVSQLETFEALSLHHNSELFKLDYTKCNKLL